MNNLGSMGRWAFLELRSMYAMATDFGALITAELDKALDAESGGRPVNTGTEG